MSPDAVVLFAGMGGASVGLERAGVRVRLAVDGWDAACIAHRRWQPDVPVVLARCEQAPVNGARPWLLWASPSCKPWSAANRTPKRGLVHPEYYGTALLVRQAVAMGARWLVVENVGGLLWSREGKVELAEMRAECQRQGLRWCASVVNSNTVGVAQIRRRVFVVVGPEYVKIPHGADYIPPENADRAMLARIRHPHGKAGWRDGGAVKGIVASEHGLARSPGTLAAWRTAQRGIVDASPASRHANWTGAHSATQGRTLAQCAALQQVPMEPLAGFSKRVAHELVGNVCPVPLTEHVTRVLMVADAVYLRAMRGNSRADQTTALVQGDVGSTSLLRSVMLGSQPSVGNDSRPLPQNENRREDDAGTSMDHATGARAPVVTDGAGASPERQSAGQSAAKSGGGQSGDARSSTHEVSNNENMRGLR